MLNQGLLRGNDNVKAVLVYETLLSFCKIELVCINLLVTVLERR